LIGHFEGDAQCDRVKDNPYASIAAAKYYGEHKKFTFETYVTIHQDAYSDLEQYGEVISEEKRGGITLLMPWPICPQPYSWDSPCKNLGIFPALNLAMALITRTIQTNLKVAAVKAMVVKEAMEEAEGAEIYTLDHMPQMTGIIYRLKIRKELLMVERNLLLHRLHRHLPAKEVIVTLHMLHMLMMAHLQLVHL